MQAIESQADKEYSKLKQECAVLRGQEQANAGQAAQQNQLRIQSQQQLSQELDAKRQMEAKIQQLQKENMNLKECANLHDDAIRTLNEQLESATSERDKLQNQITQQASRIQQGEQQLAKLSKF